MATEKAPNTINACILVRPKDGILNPEGEAVERALRTLGFAVSNVKIGRVYELVIDKLETARATEEIGRMCTDAFLVNPLMEKSEIVIVNTDPKDEA